MIMIQKMFLILFGSILIWSIESSSKEYYEYQGNSKNTHRKVFYVL